MPTRHSTVHIPVGDRRIAGTLVAPDTLVPGVLLIHGWDGSQQNYIERAHEIAALGCICLTFDLRGHAEDKAQREMVTREDNLTDILAAYDLLVSHPAVDSSNVAVIGSSYGGYLAAVLTTLRKVRWLALRVPALYKDEDWLVPKRSLNKEEVAAYRMTTVKPSENRALGACAAFRGDVLIVESELDTTVPHPVIENYRTAFERARSMTYRVISRADHSLSTPEFRNAYGTILVGWVGEMVTGARNEAQAAEAARRKAQQKGADVAETPRAQRKRAERRRRAMVARRMVTDLKNFVLRTRKPSA
ncbi:MAG: alpha/beta fold hydrolase [Burkholderiaceae bacterium]|nr:alpha/beta fold hydrolase [Burkholderiaceae bacterium]